MTYQVITHKNIGNAPEIVVATTRRYNGALAVQDRFIEGAVAINHAGRPLRNSSESTERMTMTEEQEWRSDPPSLNDVPWDELQAFRCRAGDALLTFTCGHPHHKYTIGGWAFYVPDDVLAAYAAGRIDGTEPWEA